MENLILFISYYDVGNHLAAHELKHPYIDSMYIY